MIEDYRPICMFALLMILYPMVRAVGSGRLPQPDALDLLIGLLVIILLQPPSNWRW